ncbi:MAG: anaerobic ribonucleoside-triphosphate reductase activating protein [Candidatus Aenigmarchaeota archaeon]|nr:anaerobic ribonucleoside-triphosphate reductase activating protein [Candidatus Aenigmarchaeota archaeon]
MINEDKCVVAKEMSKGIKGFQSISLIDYPEKIVSVVFFSGCNFRCPFCHNKELVIKDDKTLYLNTREVLSEIKERSKIIGGVCITGGEPTLCPWLVDFIKHIKEMNLKVKLDTNGTMPDVVKELIDEKLIDYIAMDIKAPKEKYALLCGIEKPPMDKIEKSIHIIKGSGVDYEFRTTVIPKYHTKEDITKIAEWLDGAKKFCIQQFRGINTLDPALEHGKSFSIGDLKEMKKNIKSFFKSCEIKGIDF